MTDSNMEDLLGRKVVKEDRELIGGFLKNKKVLITGGAGSIGSEIARQVLGYNPKKLILLDQNEFGVYQIEESLVKEFPGVVKTCLSDIKDLKILNKIFAKEKPEVVFHAAAYKHIPIVEDNLEMAFANNVCGTRNVLDASKEFGVKKVILISSDKAVQPKSFMGKTKKLVEILGHSYHQTFGLEVLAVRFGNVLNSSGSVIPLFLKQIENGGPVTVTHQEMERYFMSIREACLLVLEVAAIGQGGTTYVLDMGKPVKIKNLAEKMIKFSGKDVEIKYTNVRLGEKILEKLFEDSESLKKTSQRKISMVISSKKLPSLEEVLGYLDRVKESGDVSFIEKII